MDKVDIVPDIDAANITLRVSTSSGNNNLVDVDIMDGDMTVISTQVQSNEDVQIELGPGFKTWSPASPFLYDISIRTQSGDKVSSYFGMRKVELRSDGNFQKIYLNNKELTFQLGLLDQGYWPDGILTPPTEEAMKWDIEQTQKMGFNMIRKHIKIESKRFVV